MFSYEQARAHQLFVVKSKSVLRYTFPWRITEDFEEAKREETFLDFGFCLLFVKKLHRELPEDIRPDRGGKSIEESREFTPTEVVLEAMGERARRGSEYA